MARAAKKPAAAARRRRRSPALVARAAEINARLTERYPQVTTALHHHSAWELLAATILSAQSTDEVVNQVTAQLFQRYPTVADFAAAPRAELEQALYRTGFFLNKAKSVQEAARYLLEHNDGVVVDTHVTRLSRRLGLTRQTDPEKIEQDLMGLLLPQEWTNFSHRLIWFGRQVCLAKDPRCDLCELAELCPSAFKVGRWAKPAAAKARTGSKAPAARTGRRAAAG